MLKTRYKETSAFLSATAQRKTKLLKALTVATFLRFSLFCMELESVNNNSEYQINDITEASGLHIYLTIYEFPLNGTLHFCRLN